MRRIDFFGLAILYFLGFLLAGCGKDPAPPAPKDEQPAPVVVVDDKQQDKTPQPAVDNPEKPADTTSAAGMSAQEKYDAALLEALNLIADHKYADALLKMAEAKAVVDTEQIRQEIDKLKARIDQSGVAEQTTQDIKTVLADGKAEDAARLATDGLQQFGGDSGDKLANLKREAETLATVGADDKDGRRRALITDGNAALKDRNLRAAAIAYEQALQLADDADLRKQCDDLHATLVRYDDNRQKAAELRRDPVHLEEAVSALQDAQKEWDTLQVRQDLDNYTLALQKRRDRLSVADFEVRGDVGIPSAGREIAEDLLPAFKRRYDLVERAQVGKIMNELKLEASDLADNDNGREEIGRLAKVRFLVLGSVTPIGGLTAHARLVDVRSGLVVQTAKIVAPTPEKLIQRLPELAAMLQMNDQDEMDYEQKLIKQAADDVKEINAKADLPEPPPIPVAGQAVAMPPPIIPFAQRAPDFGAVKIADFGNLPLAPPAVAPVVIVEEPIRERMLRVSIELGDNAFRRGRFREAHVHFGFAMNLFPERREVRVRAERVMICLPPGAPGNPVPAPVIGLPPPVVFMPPPPPVWPRIAVMNFIMETDPFVVSPALSGWFADNMAPYFSPPFEVVDRNHVFWYMRRVGMTYADLLTNPYARRWLGRALNLRAFVFGTVRQFDNSLIISTYMVDTELGYVRGAGMVRLGLGFADRNRLDANAAVQVAALQMMNVAQRDAGAKAPDPATLRLHLANLAKQTVLDPKERDALVKKTESAQAEIAKGRTLDQKKDFAGALDHYKEALKLDPKNMEAKHLAEEADRQLKLSALEADRKRQADERLKLLAQAQTKQVALTRDAEKARVSAIAKAATLDDAQKRARDAERDAAYSRLIAQAQSDEKKKDFKAAVHSYESALALKPNDDGFRQLGLARAKVEEAAKADAAAALAAREKALAAQHEKELALAKEKVDQERGKREELEKVQKTRDDAEYKRLLEAGTAALAKEKFDDAANSLHAAKQIRNTDEVNKLLDNVLTGQAKDAAAKKGEAAKAELDRQLADEKKKREAVEGEAKKSTEKYNAALKLAQDAMTQKKYDTAAAKYQDAIAVYKTDAALTGLRAALDARDKERKEEDAAIAKQVAEKKRAEDVKNFLVQGQKFMTAKKYDQAIQAFTQAKTLAPTDVDVLTGLSKAQHARDDALAAAKNTESNAEKAAKLKEALTQGRAALAKKDFAAAGKALDSATKIDPANADVLKLKADLQSAKDGAANDAEAAKKRKIEFDTLIENGREAMLAKKYDAAVKAFTDAGKLFPQDRTAKDLLTKATDAKVLADKTTQDDKLREQFEQLISAAEADIKAGKFDAAAKALADAKKIDPKDLSVAKALQDLENARDAAAKDAAKKQRQADYEKALKAGKDALAAKKYDDAIRDFGDAGKLMPGDKDAAAMLKQAQQAKADALAASDAEAKKKKEEEKRNADFAKLMEQGQTQMTAKKYADAVSSYSDALKLKPTDAKAAAGLKNANFQQHMAEGQRLLNAKKFPDARSEFQEALKLFPDDVSAKALLKKAKDGK